MAYLKLYHALIYNKTCCKIILSKGENYDEKNISNNNYRRDGNRNDRLRQPGAFGDYGT